MYSGIKRENIHITINLYICAPMYVFHSRKIHAQETVLHCMCVNTVQTEIVSRIVRK